ncbi:thioredoxin [bacterium]|nr:thioredoxin [bacterium]
MANLEEITDANFENIVLKSQKPVLVDFWAQWCGPCVKMAPILEQIQNEFQDSLKIVKIDTDKNTQYASQYGVLSLPSFLLFEGGELKETMVGLMPKSSIISNIKKYLV